MSARKVILGLAMLISIAPLASPKPSPKGTGLMSLPLGGELEAAAPADTIPDGKPRYSVRKTGTQDTKDLNKKTADLKDPDNLKTEVIYDEKDDTYTIGTSFSDSDNTTGKGQGTRRATNTGRSTGNRNQSSSSQA